MNTENTPLRPEWSHRVPVDKIGSQPFKVNVTATPQERKDLARRLRVQAIDDLSLAAVIEREPGSHVIRVEGKVKARVVQTCVTTDQPVSEDVTEAFESWFADPGEAVPFARARRDRALNKGEREMEVLPDRDDPDQVTDGYIDVAELAAQYLSLGINPYPHAGDLPPVGEDEPAAAPARRNPFAALKDWKRQKDS